MTAPGRQSPCGGLGGAGGGQGLRGSATLNPGTSEAEDRQVQKLTKWLAGLKITVEVRVKSRERKAPKWRQRSSSVLLASV